MMIDVVWEDKKGESLTLTRLINGLWRDAHRLMLMQGVGIAIQRMHQRYKCMKAEQKKLVGVHPTRLLTKTQGILRNPIIGIYKPSSIIKDSHQYMKVTTQETLYHEDHGATLKQKCGKRLVTLSLLSFFSHFFFFFLFGPFLLFMDFLLLFLKFEVSSRLVG